jgi:hypothetical protein
MSRAAAVSVMLVVVLLALPACQMNERMTGTAFGGAGGALLGGLIAESVGGVLLGGLGGALAGYLVGDYLADQRERACCPAPAAAWGTAPVAAWSPPVAVPTAVRPQVAGVRSPTARAAADVAYEEGRRAPTAVVAADAYRRAIALDPTHADAWTALGLLHAAAGRTVEAAAAFDRALAAEPGHADARAHRTWVAAR